MAEYLNSIDSMGISGVTPGQSWVVVSGYFKKYPEWSLENNLNIWLTTPQKRDDIIFTQKYPGVPRNTRE